MLEWSRVLAQHTAALQWQDAVAGLAVALAVFGLLWGARRLARRHQRAYAGTAQREVLEWPTLVASRTTTPFLLLVSLFVALEAFELLAPPVAAVVRKIVMVAFFWQAGLWASTVASAWLDQHELTGLGNGKAKASSIGIEEGRMNGARAPA